MTASDEVRFVFWHRERVRFRDVDLQRIVYYGKYLDYFDNALYEYLRSLGFESGVLNERYGFDTSVVHAEIDYVSPASFDDLLDIGVRVTRMGRTSFDASFEVRQSGRVICRASLVLVNYDAVTARARPLPANIREAIEVSNAAATG
jgi:acyl-CoA thioester hydrolase